MGGVAKFSIPREYWRALQDAYHNGATIQALSDVTGSPKRYVVWALHQMGVSMREPGPAIRTAANATSARLSARRKELEAELIEDAHRLRAQLWEPARIQGFFGKDGEYREAELDEPQFRDKASIMSAIRAAVQSSRDISELEGGTSAAMLNLILQTAEHLGLTSDGE